MTTPQDPPGPQPGQSWSTPSPPGYGSAIPPTEGMAPGQPGPPARRPKEVDISFALWVTSILLGLVGVIFIVGQFDMIRDTMLEEVSRQAQRQGEPLGEQQLAAIAGVVLALWVGSALLFAAVQLLFAFFMRKGRDWARIVLTVLGVLILLSRLLSLGAGPAGQSAITAVAMLVLIGAIVTMFLSNANPWFRPRPRF